MVDKEVELTEEDLNNPELLQELALLDGSHQTPSNPAKVNLPVKEAVKQPVIAPAQDILDRKSIADSGPQLLILEQRLKEYKQQALLSKKQGNMEYAREMMRYVKMIQQLQQNAEMGLKVDVPSPPKPIPTPAIESPAVVKQTSVSDSPAVVKQTSALVAPKQATVQKQPVTPKEVIGLQVAEIKSLPSEQAPMAIYSHLKSTLESQIQTAQTCATNYFTLGDKSTAVQFHKRKKQYQSDLETLVQMQPVFESGVIPVTFVYQSQTVDKLLINEDLQMDEWELEIVQGKNVCPKDMPSDKLQTQVVFDLGWPRQNDQSTKEAQGQTPTVGSTNPVYEHKHIVKIQRTKPFQRHLEKKKASLTLQYKTYSMFGLMASYVVFGKIQLPLDILLTKSTFHETLDIMDPKNPRKSTGGQLEVKMRLNRPINSHHIEKIQVPWLQLTFGISQPALQPESQTVQPEEVPKTEKAEVPPVKQDSPPSVKQDSPATVKKDSQTTAQQKETDVDLDTIELQFLNPDLIISNQVLEFEHQQVLQEIQQLKGKPSDDLMDKKQAYEFRMNLLVTLIQLGKLDMPGYCQQVNQSIAETKKLALLFKKHGRLDLAKKALQRVKLMTEEMQQVEEQENE
ncbi:hypothetical protein EDD86DRAFT_195159 [Gorgonomyces haynaldii]|nr:hypothetical protein EDD86DRAFT_195159 [Gorgonomyces haynaldii]